MNTRATTNTLAEWRQHAELAEELRARALDDLAARIGDRAQWLLDRLLDPQVDEALTELTEAAWLIREHFSITKPRSPQGQPVPKGMILAADLKARGPLLEVTNLSRDLVPAVGLLLRVQRLLGDIRAANPRKETGGSGPR